MSNWQAAEEGDFQDDFDLDFDSKSNTTEKDCILFLIDCGPEMFIENDTLKGLNETSSVTLNGFQAAMKCVASVMKNKIISSETDQIGVVCYNTQKSKNPAGFPHIFQLQDLNVPDAPSILEIERFVRKHESFIDKFGSSSVEFPFGNVFWTCANVFSDKKFVNYQKRIFLFTCNDNPNGTSESLQRAAKTRGKDLNDLGISLELFAIPSATSEIGFNYKKFYSSIISELDCNESDFGSMSKFEELLSRVRRKETKKRALARSKLSLGPEMNLSIKLFSLFMETKKGQYVWMNEHSGQVMTPKTEWTCKETGRVLQSSEFKFSFDYGGERVIFSKEEMGRIYKFDDEIGLKILGFKPRSALKPSHNVTHSSFIYPDESINGSVTVFSSLLNNCLQMNKMIICRWVARKGSPPRLVALLPQAELVDHIGTQLKAPGFNMIILPFADDIRHLKIAGEKTDEDEGSVVVASHDQVDKAKALISKYTFIGKFDSETFDNPVLQSHYANLQSLALDQEPDGNLQDFTLPPYDRIKTRASDEINDFKEAFGLKNFVESSAVESKSVGKRSAAADDDYDPISAIAACKSDPKALSKFTVADMKIYLESIGIKAKRVKAEIIEQILQ